MILGVLKAKTNFPYDPQETPLQPLQAIDVSPKGKGVSLISFFLQEFKPALYFELFSHF